MKETYTVMNVKRNSTRRKADETCTTASTSVLWTLSNGVTVMVTRWVYKSSYSNYTAKHIAIQPFNGYFDKSYSEVRDCLYFVRNAAQRTFPLYKGWDVIIDI